MVKKVDCDKILIIQCDSGHLHANLIASARYKVIDEIVICKLPDHGGNESKGNSKSLGQSEAVVSKFEEKNTKCLHNIHVVFIIQLPRKSGGTNFVGFQGGDWISVHLDDLRVQKETEVSFQNMQFEDAKNLSISKIFSCTYPTPSRDLKQPPFKFNANKRLRDLIQKACSLLHDKEQNRQRTTERIVILMDLIPSKPTEGEFVCRVQAQCSTSSNNEAFP